MCAEVSTLAGEKSEHHSGEEIGRMIVVAKATETVHQLAMLSKKYTPLQVHRYPRLKIKFCHWSPARFGVNLGKKTNLLETGLVHLVFELRNFPGADSRVPSSFVCFLASCCVFLVS